MKQRIKVSDFYKEVNPQLILSIPSLVNAFFHNNQQVFTVTSSPSSINKYSFQTQASLLVIPLQPQMVNKVEKLIQVNGIVCFFLKGEEEFRYFKENRLYVVKTHLAPITVMTQHKSKLYTGSEDMTIRLWNVEKEGVHPDPQKHAICGHTLKITSFLSFGQLLLSGSADKTIIIWQGYQQKSCKRFESQIQEIIFCEQSQQVVVRQLNGKISVFCGNTLRKSQNLIFLRQIKGITLNPIKDLQQIDDSFLQVMGNTSLEIVEINHGSVMGQVEPGIGSIISSKCTRAVNLLAVAGKGIFLLNF